MVPALFSGDFVVNFDHKISRCKVGDIVVVRHRELGDIVKRVTEIDSNNCLRLAGDNPLSTTSDELGWQQPDTVLGKVVWHIPVRH